MPRHAVTTDLQQLQDAAASDATTKANAAKSAAATDATQKANAAKSDAISTASGDATTKANNAKNQAEAAANAAKEVRVAENLAALKAMGAGSATSLVLMKGRADANDGLGGTYYWDAASTEAEDTTYLNVVQATGVTAGRWKRNIVRVMVLPQGVLVTGNGGLKTLYATAQVVGSAGLVTLNLTTDNTANGPSIFTEIWENTSMVKPPMVATVIEDTPAVTVQTETLKQTVHVATRGNKTTLPTLATALLGLVITPLRYAPAGTTVRITVTGI